MYITNLRLKQTQKNREPCDPTQVVVPNFLFNLFICLKLSHKRNPTQSLIQNYNFRGSKHLSSTFNSHKLSQ